MSLSSANRTLQLVVRLLDAKNATEPLIDFGPQKPAIPLGRSAQPLPRETPERQGIPSRHIAGFLNTLKQDPTLRMHSVLVVRNGKLLCSAAFGAQNPELPKMTFSACKSITALAVGLLMDDGLLTPEDRLVDLFPQECGPLSKRLMKDLTVESLLTMRTGNQFNEASSMTEADWVRGFFLSPSLTDPAGKFQYNSLNTYILAVLVHRLTGQTLTEFLTARLFAPMGIADFHWETSPEGVEKGGWGLYMRPEDLAKLGQLVMDNGQWNGRQLISQHFLEQATKAHVQTPEHYGDYNYGWQIWVGRQENSFLFNGMLGQNVLGFRDSGIILVSHAGNSETFQQSSYFRLASHYFGGSFPASLPKDPLAERELGRTLMQLSDCSGPLPSREAFARFAGKRFVTRDPKAAASGLLPLTLQAVENSYSKGLQAITVGGTRAMPEIFYEERDQLHHLKTGTKTPCYQSLNFHGNVFQVAAQARFTHNEEEQPVLRIQVDFLETPCTRIIKLIWTPQGLLVRQEETPNMDYLVETNLLAVSNPASKALLATLLGSADPDFLSWKMGQVFSPTMEFQEEA